MNAIHVYGNNTFNRTIFYLDRSKRLQEQREFIIMARVILFQFALLFEHFQFTQPSLIYFFPSIDFNF